MKKQNEDAAFQFIDECGNGIYTKPKCMLRFHMGRANEWNYRLYPHIYNKGARTIDIYQTSRDPELKLMYLKQDESALRTLEPGTIKQLNYDPWNDIDRYFIKCLRGNVEGASCPAWQKLRQMCSVRECEETFVEPSALVAVRDNDGMYGEPNRIYIGNGDGRVGPIAANDGLCRRNPLAELARLCESCKFCGTPSVVCTIACDDKAKNTNNDHKNIHGGIIAFFKRLFGRGKKEIK